MSRNHKKLCTSLTYTEHFLVLASTITGYISIPDFAILLNITTGIGICAIATGIKSVSQ